VGGLPLSDAATPSVEGSGAEVTEPAGYDHPKDWPYFDCFTSSVLATRRD